MKTEYSRLRVKRSNSPVAPTMATSSLTPTMDWLTTDIMVGEIFLSSTGTVSIGTEDGIKELAFGGSASVNPTLEEVLTQGNTMGVTQSIDGSRVNIQSGTQGIIMNIDVLFSPVILNSLPNQIVTINSNESVLDNCSTTTIINDFGSYVKTGAGIFISNGSYGEFYGCQVLSVNGDNGSILFGGNYTSLENTSSLFGTQSQRTKFENCDSAIYKNLNSSSIKNANAGPGYLFMENSNYSSIHNSHRDVYVAGSSMSSIKNATNGSFITASNNSEMSSTTGGRIVSSNTAVNFAGNDNRITNVSNSGTIGGQTNIIQNTGNSLVLAGNNHTLDGFTNSVIIGGESITGDFDNTAFVQHLVIRPVQAPTASADTFGSSKGDITWDNNYVYVKTNAGWKRATLNTF